jgi:four helix bundle protein
MTPQRAPARKFEDLVVWQKAHRFVLAIYEYTAAFPKSETYGLFSQMRRAAVSIPANIAEGFKRAGRADKVRMLNIAEGSVDECRYYLVLAHDLGYGSSKELASELDEAGKMLGAYARAIDVP